MKYLLSILGLVLSVVLLKYRERAGDMIGEADWMHYVGGVYNFIILVSVALFFWSIATLTGTGHIFMAPIMGVMGIQSGTVDPSAMPL